MQLLRDSKQNQDFIRNLSNWVDDLVKSIAEIPNEVLVLFVVS